MHVLLFFVALTVLPDVPDPRQQPQTCQQCEHHASTEAQIRQMYRDGFDGCILLMPTEHDIFLGSAERNMLSYRRAHGRFARDWHELKMSFVGNGFTAYRHDDPRIYPSGAQGNRWRPLISNYTYVLTSSSDDGFVIEIFNEDGVKVHRVVKSYPRPDRELQAP